MPNSPTPPSFPRKREPSQLLPHFVIPAKKAVIRKMTIIAVSRDMLKASMAPRRVGRIKGRSAMLIARDPARQSSTQFLTRM